MQLADDGLSIVGEMEHVYDGWTYPEEWDVEVLTQEGPNITRHGDDFYMILAEGSTAGPATCHMVVCARSRSVHAPWENAPHNPIIRDPVAEGAFTIHNRAMAGGTATRPAPW